MSRHVVRMIGAALLLGTALASQAQTQTLAQLQDYPKKQPVRIVVPYNPGGGTDTCARILAEFLQRRWGQTVIVDNKPGATGTIGGGFVAKAPADGYTLLFAPASDFTVNPAVRKNMPFKVEDYSFLVRSFTSIPVVLASPKSSFTNVKDLVAFMKANPGKVPQGTPGVGNIVHLGMALFEASAGVNGLFVPYQGAGPMYLALMEGSVEISQTTPPFPETLRVLASSGSKRSPFYPNAPTLDELGIKGAAWEGWFAMVAPQGLPKPIADFLIEEITAVLKTPEALAKLETAKLPPDGTLVGDAFKAKVQEEIATWKMVVERQKLVIE